MDIQDLVGQTIKGYELKEKIGVGGFGAVYRASQPLVKREVAVKVILPDYTNNAEFVRRFEAEAQLVANLEHPHIVPLYDYWRSADGAFLIMRLLRGGSMKTVLGDGHWPLMDIPRALDQIAGALAVAHRNGVIHRDLKPENILLDGERNTYLADFGIAKDLNRITDAATFIEQAEGGRLVGSPDFMAPEQIQSGDITPQTDIYSLGVLLYMMLTGRKPFQGENISVVISKHLFESLPDIQEVRPDLPDELNRVIERATEKQPADRYPDVLTMAQDFRSALAATSTGEFEVLERIAYEPDPAEIESATLVADTVDYSEGSLARAVVENPYKGLRAFREADANDFYGRSEAVQLLLDRLAGGDRRARFIALVGASGSGKSSLVRAGLLPALRAGQVDGSDRWFITDMTPGTHPTEELEAALLRVAVTPPGNLMEPLKSDGRGLVRAAKRILPGGDDADTELVLLIDQFEEVFTQVSDEAERAHFLTLLTEAANDPAGRLRIIVTLRADFYDRPLAYPDFGELVRACGEVLLPLSRDNLRAAIIEPAHAEGLTLEDGLVSAVMTDVNDQPGMLPMVQYALTELFERRQGRRLTRAAYDDIGGVLGALARRAEDIYDELGPGRQALTRQVMVRLVTLGEGTEDTRRRAPLAELLAVGEPDAVQAILDRFGAYRLLSFDHDPASRAPTVEVAHEALIRRWDRLRAWLNDSRDDLRTGHKLTALAREWAAAGKDPSYLVSGARLETFEAWLGETTVAVTDDERGYLQQSLHARQQAEQEAAQQAAREAALQKRSRRILRALVAVMTVAALAGAVLSAVALDQRGAAQQNAATAVAAQGLAESEADRAATAAAVAASNEREARELALIAGAGAALAADNAEFALLLAIEAVNITDEPSLQAVRTLANAAYTPGTRRLYTGHTDRVEAVAYTPDGTRFISGSDDGLVIMWDAASGEIIHRMAAHTGPVWDVALNADGTRALSASADGTAVLWDTASGEPLRTLDGHTGDVGAVAFLPNGETALTAGHDALMIQWDLTTGDELTRFGADGSGHTAQINAVAVSGGGFTALTASDDRSVILWSLATGAPVQRYQETDAGLYSVVYTPDELGMLTGASDGRLQLWSFETGAPVRTYEGHTDRVTGISLSADGMQFASSSQDGTAILWDVNRPVPQARYIGHTDRVYDIAFHPVDAAFITAGWDTTLRLWDTRDGAELARLDAPTADVLAVSVSPDGERIAGGTVAGDVWLWQPADETTRQLPNAHTGAVNGVAFLPDGERLLSGGDDARLLLWDAATGDPLREFDTGHRDGILTVAVNPDGTQAVTGSRDSTGILWDIESGAPTDRLFGHTFQILSAAFSPDGRSVATAGRDFDVILWEAATGNQIRTFEVHNDWVFTAVYSPDGTRILSGGGENNLILWETATGQPLRTFEGHTAFIYDAAFSPDGRYVASAAADSAVIVWNANTGEIVRRLDGHTDGVRAIAYTPDGGRLVTGSGDNTLRLWQVQLTADELLAWVAENRHTRDLTCAEREQYDIEPLCPPATPIFDPETI